MVASSWRLPGVIQCSGSGNVFVPAARFYVYGCSLSWLVGERLHSCLHDDCVGAALCRAGESPFEKYGALVMRLKQWLVDCLGLHRVGLIF